jgi:hypothetical protein
MNTDDESVSEQWTPEDSARLASLPRERIPPHELKRRTMEAARSAGYLRSTPRRAGLTLALIAAASLIFVAGALLGYALARRATPESRTTASTRTDGLASTQGFNIQVDSGRHVVWY